MASLDRQLTLAAEQGKMFIARYDSLGEAMDEQNPYAAPSEGRQQSSTAPMPFSIIGFVVKYSTATLGAVLVFAGAFLATLFVPYWLSGILWHVVPSLYTTAAGRFGTLGVAFLVGALAGTASFRATVRVYSRKKKGRPECSFLPIGDR